MSSEATTPINRRVTLTFDNGPHLKGTPRILDMLAERSLGATFFFVGKHLADPDLYRLAERARQSGHRIGNHTYTHGTPLGKRPGTQVAQDEIATTQQLLGPLTEERLFRPNAGMGKVGAHLLSADATALLAAQRYSVVIWNCVPGDWIGPPGAWRLRADREMEALPWTTLVLHDHRQIEAPTVLEQFLDQLILQGAEFSQSFSPDVVLMQDGLATPRLAACTTTSN